MAWQSKINPFIHSQIKTPSIYFISIGGVFVMYEVSSVTDIPSSVLRECNDSAPVDTTRINHRLNAINHDFSTGASLTERKCIQ